MARTEVLSLADFPDAEVAKASRLAVDRMHAGGEGGLIRMTHGRSWCNWVDVALCSGGDGGGGSRSSRG